MKAPPKRGYLSQVLTLADGSVKAKWLVLGSDDLASFPMTEIPAKYQISGICFHAQIRK